MEEREMNGRTRDERDVDMSGSITAVVMQTERNGPT
jgi:flagellar basal body L-ring protein FlgH